MSALLVAIAFSVLPKNPVLFVANRGDVRLDVVPFTRADGTPIEARVTPANFGDRKLWQVRLKIDSGVLNTGERIDPAFVPTTRSVDVIDRWPEGEMRETPIVDIDADSELFVMQCGSREYTRVTRVFALCRPYARVIALYPDGRTDMILEYTYGPPSVARVRSVTRDVVVVLKIAGALLAVALLGVGGWRRRG